MAAVPSSAIPAGLPSSVDESFAACPKFRIVAIGKSGVGKSSLVSSVFNINLGSGQVDVAHDRAGKADITHAYSSHENPRFILHDSVGFEPGSQEKWTIVEKFLHDRTHCQDMKERVHAIWLCIETPRTGSRLLQTGDEKLLELADKLKIPVIAVFTKCDMLVKEHFRKLRKDRNVPTANQKPEAERLAETDFSFRVKSAMQVPCVQVSTVKDSSYLRKTLSELADTTQKALPNVEEELRLPWAAAQQVDGSQKVESSISEGFKKYWVNLGTASVFQGYYLNHCIARIHDDILKVWNLNDPRSLLSEDNFRAKIIQLVEPLLSELNPGQSDQPAFSSVFSAIKTIAFDPIGFLYQTYQTTPLTARYLGAYIVELILILHRLFTEIVVTVAPPRALTENLISRALEGHQPAVSVDIHSRLKAAAPGPHLPIGVEKKVAALVRELALGTSHSSATSLGFIPESQPVPLLHKIDLYPSIQPSISDPDSSFIPERCPVPLGHSLALYSSNDLSGPIPELGDSSLQLSIPLDLSRPGNSDASASSDFGL